MKFYSLGNRNRWVDIRKATLEGQSVEGGLYYPEFIPKWEKEFIHDLKRLSNVEIGQRIMHPYVKEALDESALHDLMQEVLTFDFPLTPLDDDHYILELFHGPTLAFKDLGARFLSKMIASFALQQDKKIVVLVATSGDTGGAVAHAFWKVPGIEVVILYPSGKVSEVQEKQLTTLGENIHALEVKGDFDDCQSIVKRAFKDQDLQSSCTLTSSNSINVCRWLPQQIYYAIGKKNFPEVAAPVISVPSGNFGNLCAGLLAQQSGLPVEHFIAACNSNDAVVRYMESGIFEKQTSVATYSNAMDVGNPSNWVRIEEMFSNDWEILKKYMSANSTSDIETLETIREVYATKGIILDPHTAVGYHVLKKYKNNKPFTKGIVLGTAHPVKFPSVVQEALHFTPSIPKELENLLESPKKNVVISPDYKEFKSLFLEEIPKT